MEFEFLIELCDMTIQLFVSVKVTVLKHIKSKV